MGVKMEKKETMQLFEANKRELFLLNAKSVIERAEREIERDYVFDTSQWRTIAPRVNSKT